MFLTSSLLKRFIDSVKLPGPSPSRSIKITFQQKVVLDIALEDLVDALADCGYESDGSLDSKAGRELDEDEDVNPILGDFECDPNLKFAMHETLPDLSDLTESEPENGPISHKRTVDMAALDKTAKKKLKKKNYNKRRRKEKRIETSGDEPYSKLVGDRRCNEADIITLDCDAAKLPVSSTGWQGVRKTGFEEYTGLSREETIALPGCGISIGMAGRLLVLLMYSQMLKQVPLFQSQRSHL